MLHDPEALLLLGMPEPQVAALLNGDSELQVFDRVAIAEDGEVITANGVHHAVRQVTGPLAVFKVDAAVAAPATKDKRELADTQGFRLPKNPSDGDECVFVNLDAAQIHLYIEAAGDRRVDLVGQRGRPFRAMGGVWHVA